MEFANGGWIEFDGNNAKARKREANGKRSESSVKNMGYALTAWMRVSLAAHYYNAVCCIQSPA